MLSSLFSIPICLNIKCHSLKSKKTCLLDRVGRGGCSGIKITKHNSLYQGFFVKRRWPPVTDVLFHLYYDLFIFVYLECSVESQKGKQSLGVTSNLVESSCLSVPHFTPNSSSRSVIRWSISPELGEQTLWKIFQMFYYFLICLIFKTYH